MRDTSLVFPLDGQGRILLGRKKRGMGYGKWNGFGGKMEIGESMRECALRELFEECGLFAEEKDLILVADLYFDQPSDGNWSHGGMVYVLKKFTGTIEASDEMEPRWFSLEDLPYEDMWEADKTWIPLILQNKQVRGTIAFAEYGSTVLDAVFREVLLDSRK